MDMRIWMFVIFSNWIIFTFPLQNWTNKTANSISLFLTNNHTFCSQGHETNNVGINKPVKASITTPLSSYYGDVTATIENSYSANLKGLTWPAVLCTFLVDHLFDSASKQHSWGVMVEGLECFAGAVGFLSGHAAGSLLSVSRGGGVTALPILVSFAVSLSVSLALGQRAERPLLPHPFHAACMLGIQLPPLHRRCSPDTLATGLFHSFLSPSPSFSGCDSRLGPFFLSKGPSPLLNHSRSLLQSIQCSTDSTWRKRDGHKAQITHLHLLHLQKRTKRTLAGPPHRNFPALKPHLWTPAIHDFSS